MSHILGAVVTLGGECFEIEFERREPDSDRDGSLFLFRVRDLKQGRGERLVQLFRSGQLAKAITDYATRADIAHPNAIRRAFDARKLNFDVDHDPERYEEVKLTASDFKPGRSATEQEIREYIKQKAYWLGWKNSSDPSRHYVPFDREEDLDYLGVERKDVRRHVVLLVEQGLLHPADAPGAGRPTPKLIVEYNPNYSAETSDKQREDWKFAKMALEEARKSVAEDERIHPRVGAVAVKDGHVLAAAHRGESAEGHAEFTLLAKKLHDVPLTGATVYTTLEPCTTRNLPKIPCADRLIQRRVARVVIGMLDPDQRIRGLGQRKLRDARIIVDSFPPDLADQVEELNHEFTRSRMSNHAPDSEPAFEIIFDPDNAGRQFWSLRTVDSDSRQIPGIQYRVKVRNRTNKTLYEVKATSETLGQLGSLPTRLEFEQTAEVTFTLDPGASAFINLFFVPLPLMQPGTVTGASSSAAYGPIRVTISALNTATVERTFQFNPLTLQFNPYEQPMIS
jgi:pyrimidine deaminase RibD-like protein